MKTGTTTAALLGILGGAALGVWIGADMATPDLVSAPMAAVQPVEAPAPAPVKVASRRGRVARAATSEAPKLVMTIPVSAPELHDRMKPVLARGTKIPMAAAGFTDAVQFATLAHAARNTQVPFILLKHRVLTEGQSLEQAIRASKPDLDAASEVERARTEARSDVSALIVRVSASN